MAMLRDRVALVTGASRGVGKGIALGLAEAGAIVYVTGRTVHEGHGVAGLPGTIQQTVAAVNQLGGQGIGIRCDHRDDEQVRALFERITTDHGRLDILVNNVWGGYEYFWDGTKFWAEKGFWTMPLSRWEAMFQAGVRAHFVCSALAAPLMVKQRSGLIVNISYFAAQKDDSGVIYGVAKAADDRMAACMAHDLREFSVAAVSLYPGLVRTESVLRAAERFDSVELGVPAIHRACGLSPGGGPRDNAQVGPGAGRGGTSGGIWLRRYRWPVADIAPRYIGSSGVPRWPGNPVEADSKAVAATILQESA